MDIKEIFLTRWVSTNTYNDYIESFKEELKRQKKPIDNETKERVKSMDIDPPPPPVIIPSAPPASSVFKGLFKKKDKEEKDTNILSKLSSTGLNVVGNIVKDIVDKEVSEEESTVSKLFDTFLDTDKDENKNTILQIEENTLNISDYTKVIKKLSKKLVQLGGLLVDTNDRIFNILSKNISNISFLGKPLKTFNYNGSGILVENDKMYLVDIVNNCIKEGNLKKLPQLHGENRFNSLIEEVGNNGNIIPIIFDKEETLYEYNSPSIFTNKSLSFVGSK